jgi:hypothetical protein
MVAAGADELGESDEGRRGAAPTVLQLVPSSSDAGDESDASSLGLAEEPVLAGIVPIQRPAGVAPTAARAGDGEVVNLGDLSIVTARPARCRSSRNEA